MGRLPPVSPRSRLQAVSILVAAVACASWIHLGARDLDRRTRARQRCLIEFHELRAASRGAPRGVGRSRCAAVERLAESPDWSLVFGDLRARPVSTAAGTYLTLAPERRGEAR